MSDKVDEYLVVRDSNLDVFIATVNTMIAGGWVPIGGITVSVENISYFQGYKIEDFRKKNTVYHQAIVRYHEKF